MHIWGIEIFQENGNVHVAKKYAKICDFETQYLKNQLGYEGQ